MAKNVTIQRIVGVLLQRIKFIILATVVMGLLFFMYSRFVIAPMYSTSTMIYVQNYSSSQRANANANTKSTTPSKADDDTTKKTTNEENQKIYPADISASANLAEICVTLFKNSDEMTALYDGCTVNVDVTDGTFFITITVETAWPRVRDHKIKSVKQHGKHLLRCLSFIENGCYRRKSLQIILKP